MDPFNQTKRSEKFAVSKTKIILAAFVWLIVLAIGVSIWKLVIDPVRTKSKTESAKQQAEAAVAATSGTSRFSQEIAIGLDSFSGYAIFRTTEFQNQLANRGIKLKLVEDAPDYTARAAALEKGTLQFALFPADALLKTFSKLEYPPATIIAIIDETRGADAMLAYRKRFENVDRLNSPDVRFVLVGDSPSETLARVVIQDFGLNQVSKDAIVSLASPEKLIERYQNAAPSTNDVYVVWEPFVSQMLKNDDRQLQVYGLHCRHIGRQPRLLAQAGTGSGSGPRKLLHVAVQLSRRNKVVAVDAR